MKNRIFSFKRTLSFTAISIIILLFVPGCLNMMMPENDGNGGTPPATSEILIQGMAFTPAMTTISVGTTVTWTNKDASSHSVTSNTGAFDSGTINANGTFSFKFVNPGTYLYHCSFHPSMTATIAVN